MTFIQVMAPVGRLRLEQRRKLARTLTDAVLVVEVGKMEPAARRGYQVRFVECAPDTIAHGGELLSDKPSDVMIVDVAVMDCCWTRQDRKDVILNIYAALAEACGVDKPSPAWWVNFRIIENGNWGSRGGVLLFDHLLDVAPNHFSEERAESIRTALAVKYDR